MYYELRTKMEERYQDWTSCEMHGHLSKDGHCTDCGECSDPDECEKEDEMVLMILNDMN